MQCEPCTCQLWVIECHIPTLPILLSATNWLPIKNNLSTLPDNEKVPRKKKNAKTEGFYNIKTRRSE